MNKKMIYLLMIVLLGIFLRLIYMQTGIGYPTSLLALESAHFKEGIYDPNIIWHPMGIRYILVGLVSISFSLFGVSKYTLFLTSFIFSVLNIILLYFFGKCIKNEEVGLFAAFLLAIFPLDVFNATIMEADITLSFFIICAMFCYYYFYKTEKPDYYFIIVGVIIALGFFVKIFALLLFPILLSYELFTRQKMRTLVYRSFFVLIGFFILSLPFFMYQYLTTGDMLYNYNVEKQHVYHITYIKENLQPSLSFIPPSFGLETYPKYMFAIFSPDSLGGKQLTDGIDPMLNVYFIVLFFALIYFIRKKDKTAFFLTLWILIPTLIFEFYYYIQKVQRYLLISAIPLCLLLGYFGYNLLEEKINNYQRKTIIISIICFLLVLISIIQLGVSPFFEGINFSKITDQEEALTQKLEDYPKKDIYVSHYDNSAYFTFYSQYSINSSLPYGYRGPASTSFYDLHTIKKLEDIHDAYVFIDLRYLLSSEDVMGYYKSMNLSSEQFTHQNIPQQWESITTLYGQDGSLYAELFYAP